MFTTCLSEVTSMGPKRGFFVASGGKAGSHNAKVREDLVAGRARIYDAPFTQEAAAYHDNDDSDDGNDDNDDNDGNDDNNDDDDDYASDASDASDDDGCY